MKCLKNNLPQTVERYALETPHSIAVKWSNQQLSYAELNSRSNQFAHCLKTMGVVPGVCVGLCLPRDMDMVVCLVAILKLGATYLPLDVDYPKKRLRAIIEQASPKVLVGETNFVESLAVDIAPLCPHRDAAKIEFSSVKNIRESITENLPCYIVFTSGSTGKPKGVVVSHGNIAQIFEEMGHHISASADDIWSQLHSISFGFSVFEIFGALMSGACVSIAPKEARADVRNYLQQHGVTVVSQTPSAFRETTLSSVFDNVWSSLAVRILVLSGERVQSNDLSRWTKRIDAFSPRLFNTAITETAGNVTIREYTSANSNVNNIGKPLDSVHVHILDDKFQPLAHGELGELYISGNSVAHGYLNDPELTASRFLSLPGIDGRLYCTGDMVKQLPDKSIEFVGRVDHQVKWRGHRLELGEIESVLQSHPEISTAAVTIQDADTSNPRLVAYIVPNENQNLNGAEFWTSLGGYQIYDDFLFDLMSVDTIRNDAFTKALRRTVRDCVVLDLGTGPHALLAQMAARAGAKKVYALEVLPDMAQKAKNAVAASEQSDQIKVIVGDATVIEPPEGVDVCTQGIIGNIGSADGIVPIWNGLRKKMGDVFTPIPERCVTMIAAVELPDELYDSPTFSSLSKQYLTKIFSTEGRSFDPRLCIRNINPEQLISDSQIFEDLDFNNELPESLKQKNNFTLKRAGRFDGFLLWTVVTVFDDITLNYLDHQHAWLPVFMPLSIDSCELSADTIIQAEWEWSVKKNSIFPDYSVTAKFKTQQDQWRVSNYTTCHHEETLGGTPIHEKLKSAKNSEQNMSSSELHAWLNQYLPKPVIPNKWVFLESLPINSNGKLDRDALPLTNSANVNVASCEPQSELEVDLLDIWLSVLGDHAIGIKDNFFEVGGDSITAVRLTRRVQQFFDEEVALSAIFEAPTISEYAYFLSTHFSGIVNRYHTNKGQDTVGDETINQLSQNSSDVELLEHNEIDQVLSSVNSAYNQPGGIAQILSAQRQLVLPWEGKQTSSDSFIFTLSEHGKRHPLFWCFQSHQEHIQLAKYLGVEQPLHGLRSAHLIIEPSNKNFVSLARFYANEIIQLQPSGPILIGGNCQGGILSQEIASYLLELGREVAMLFLMEVSSFQVYPQPVILLYGRESEYNPYRSVGEPNQVFQRYYPAGFSVSFINGMHGQFFSEKNISSLAQTIDFHLEHINAEVLDGAPE